MSAERSPNDVYSDSTVNRVHINNVPRLTWKLSSPETSDDETNVQPTGNDQSRQEHEYSSNCEANNITNPYKNLCGGLNNCPRTHEDSATTCDIHDDNNTIESDTLMDVEITLSPTLLKENGCPDTWDDIIDAVLAEDRNFSELSTDIIPQIDNKILTLSSDEENEAEQSSCQVNKGSEQQPLSEERTPRAVKSSLISNSSKHNEQLEDIFENETEMMGERLSQTLVISPQVSQSELQSESLVVSTQIQNMQKESPKKTAKFIISQPKGRGKNLRKLLSSLNRCKQVKVKSQKSQPKKHPVAISSNNNLISYDRKYRRYNTALPKRFGSGYMLRTTQQREPETAVNVFKESFNAEKTGVTFARSFGIKSHERGRKSLQRRVRNRVSELKEELFLWVSGKCQMTLARMRRILVEAKAAKELCTTLLFECKSAYKQKELQEIQRMCDWLVSHVSKAMQESTVNNSLLQHSSTSSSQTSFSTVGPSSSEFYSPTSDEVEGLDVSTNKTSHSLGNKTSCNPHYQQKKSGKFFEMSSVKRTVGQAVHVSSSDDEEIVKFSLQKSDDTESSFSYDSGSRKLRKIRSRHGASSSCLTSMNRHHFKNISTQTSGSEDSDHPVEDVEVSNSDTFPRISTSIAVKSKNQYATSEKNHSSTLCTSKSTGTETSDTCSVFDIKQSQDISKILQKVFPERKISLTKIILNTSQENSASWQPVAVENLCKNDTGRTGEVRHHHLPSPNAQELIVIQDYGDSLSNNKATTDPNNLGIRETETILTNNTKQIVSVALSPDNDCNKNSLETSVVECTKNTHTMKSANDGIQTSHSSHVPSSGLCHLQNSQQKSAQILTSMPILCDTEQHREAADSQELSFVGEFAQATKTSRKENNILMKQPKVTDNNKYVKKTEKNNRQTMSDKVDSLSPSCSHHNQLGDSGFDTQHSSWQMNCGMPRPNNVSTLNRSEAHISETVEYLPQLPPTHNCELQTQGESISILADPGATNKHYENTIGNTAVKETEKQVSSIFKIMPSQQCDKPKPPFYEVPPQTIFDIVTLCLPSRGEYIPNDQLPEGFWENPDFPWLPEWIDDLDEWDE